MTARFPEPISQFPARHRWEPWELPAEPCALSLVTAVEPVPGTTGNHAPTTGSRFSPPLGGNR